MNTLLREKIMQELTQDDCVLAFLEKRGADYGGRVLDEIWSFNDIQIETTHDFIQWIFPLPKERAGQLSRPVVTSAGLERISTSSYALANLGVSQEWFLCFLSRSTAWMANYNHNHLRITRMIKSSRLIEGTERSAALFRQVVLLAGQDADLIGTKAISFWTDAYKPSGNT